MTVLLSLSHHQPPGSARGKGVRSAPGLPEVVWTLHSILADPESTPSAARAAKQRLLRILAGSGDPPALKGLVPVIRLPRPEGTGDLRKVRRRPRAWVPAGEAGGDLRWDHQVSES